MVYRVEGGQGGRRGVGGLAALFIARVVTHPEFLYSGGRRCRRVGGAALRLLLPRDGLVRLLTGYTAGSKRGLSEITYPTPQCAAASGEG